MPIATDPTATFPIILDSDKDKTPAQVFHFRYPTVNRKMRLADRFEHPDNYQDVVTEITATLDELLARTEGFECSDGIANVLTTEELFELAAKVMQAGSPTGQDPENSESPAP